MKDWEYIVIGAAPFGLLIGHEYGPFAWQFWAFIAANAWLQFLASALRQNPKYS